MSTDIIHKQILLRAPLARVWKAVTDSSEFGRWFGMRFDAPFVAGTRATGTLTPTEADPEVAKAQRSYEGTRFEFTIVDLVPRTRFSFRWHPFAVDPKVDYSKEPTTLVVFAFEEQPAGVQLTITESGFDGLPLARRAAAFGANDEGWAEQIALLAKYLAHAQ
jgi:uncharacterized protein YndB with AHSA1/START domain